MAWFTIKLSTRIWKFTCNFFVKILIFKAQKRLLQEKIERKKQQLNELKRQEQALLKLYERNSQPEYANTDESSKVVLPFIIVHTKKQAIIECEMDEQG